MHTFLEYITILYVLFFDAYICYCIFKWLKETPYALVVTAATSEGGEKGTGIENGDKEGCRFIFIILFSSSFFFKQM